MKTSNRPSELNQAIQLYRDGKHQESRDCLRDFLLKQPAHVQALLWLAKVTPDPQEAVAAADLALKLDPGNEIAQRAVLTVRERERFLWTRSWSVRSNQPKVMVRLEKALKPHIKRLST